MYIADSKKMIILYILDILKNRTDENHRLSQKKIADILKDEYNVKAERKALHRYIMDLKDYLEDTGYSIEYTKTVRKVPVINPVTKDYEVDPQTNERVLVENEVYSDFYMRCAFTDGELRLLIDSLLFSPHIPYHQFEELADKLGGLSNNYFKSRVRHISCVPKDNKVNQELFFNIEVLDEAISQNHKVSFKYMEYGTDKKRYAKKDRDGNDKIYIISPYQMAAKEGKYYLICNNNDYDDISNFRVDRIHDVNILDEVAKPYESLQWANGKRLDLAAYMKEHIYMYASDSSCVKFKVVHAMVTDVIDIFGKDVRFLEQDEKFVTVSANINEMAMLQFAKRHIPDVVVLEPKRLRDTLKEELISCLELYK